MLSLKERRFGAKPVLIGIFLFLSCNAWAQTDTTLAERIQGIINRPEYKHSHFGIELYSLDEQRTIYSLNPDQFMVPGSTTKMLTEGAGLCLLGPDFRFHTHVYRTGPIVAGVLQGDLVLVASGDPNLSNRVQPDGTLAFMNDDHDYDMQPGAQPVPGDPLLVIRELAGQVAAHGIKRIEGRVLVDDSLFRSEAGEINVRLTLSPIMVNDNLVDLTLEPTTIAAPALLKVSPETAYVRFINQTQTRAAGGAAQLQFGGSWASDVKNPDGTHTVTVSGMVPQGKSTFHAYHVPEPVQFAEMTFTEALRDKGIGANADLLAKPDFKTLASSYREENEVAEHVSPPLTEEAKVTLKVSQNVHASMMPFIIGSVLGHTSERADFAGLGLMHKLFEDAGLDLNALMQNDGAGGAMFTPDFGVKFLTYMSRQPFFPAYLKALPILGKDGTLAPIQASAAAAGHVFAKTGTAIQSDAINKRMMLVGKGLAGYIVTPDGRKVAFAAFVNSVPIRSLADMEMAGQALGEIASAAYDLLTH